MFALTQNARRWLHSPFVARRSSTGVFFFFSVSLLNVVFSKLLTDHLELSAPRSWGCIWSSDFKESTQENSEPYLWEGSASYNYNFLFELIISSECHSGHKQHLSSVWIWPEYMPPSFFIWRYKNGGNTTKLQTPIHSQKFDRFTSLGSHVLTPNWSLSLCLINRTSCVRVFINSAEWTLSERRQSLWKPLHVTACWINTLSKYGVWLNISTIQNQVTKDTIWDQKSKKAATVKWNATAKSYMNYCV